MPLIARLAVRNVRRNRRRTALTVAAAAFAVIAIVHMIALTVGVHERGIENDVRMHSGHLQIAGAGALEDPTPERFVEWTPALARAIDATPGVAAAAPRVLWPALLSHGERSQSVLLLGVDPEREARVSTWPARLLPRGTFLAGAPGEIVLGDSLAASLGVGVGDDVLLFTSAYTEENAYETLRVGGLVHTPEVRGEGGVAFLRLPEAQTMLAYEGRASDVAVLVRDSDRVAAIGAALARAVATASRVPLEVNPWWVVRPDLDQMLAIDNVQNYSELAIVVAVVAFGLLNTITMSVLERQRELGVMLALGLPPRALFRLVYLESLSLAALGLAVGLALAVPAAAYMQRHPIALGGEAGRMAESFGFEAVVAWKLTPANPCIAAALMGGIALLAALYPAAKAAAARPVDALRSL